LSWTPRPLDNPRDGMQDFSRWYRAGTAPRKISPSDIDCVFHDKIKDRCLFIEFKPHPSQLHFAQLWTLQCLVRQGNAALVVCCEQKDEPYADSDPIRVGEVLANGATYWSDQDIAWLNRYIKKFYE